MHAVAQRPVFWILAAVGLSALTAALIVMLVVRGSLEDFSPGHVHHHESDPADGNEGGTFHDWLHEQLAITPEQEKNLAPIERSYGQSRAKLLARVESGGVRLAEVLGSSPVDQSEIDAALSEIQSAQGSLQTATIRHFLEMKDHLTPEQADKLLQWTRESIAHEHGR
jgi:Spy/CpxP family protein refolding chaperone